jgi:polysaccharide deacetylase family protein (PEP-CTERM system associated)
MKQGSNGRCAMTVDVEDYYHVSAFEKNIKPGEWSDLPSRVERNTRELLDLFAEQNVKSTFFVLGWVAEHYPALVREIHEAGHEIASHGYSHQLIYNQTPEVFREETTRSKAILEDLIQTPVRGYRGSSYSITKRSLWALDILAEHGFSWDSSIFPVRHDRYGIPNSPVQPYKIRLEGDRELVEFPLTTARFAGLNLPAAGGGYFRLYPYWLSRHLLKKACHDKPGIFYLHPWEIDPDQPRVAGASLLSRFRHYNNLTACMPRLRALIADFQFGTVSSILDPLEDMTVVDSKQLG